MMMIPILMLFAVMTQGQILPEGSIVSLHLMTVTLDPDVTMNQFLDFFANKWIPAVEENTEGIDGILLKWDRGENPNLYAYMWVFESQEARSRYWPKPDQSTEAWNAVIEKLMPVIDEFRRLGSWEEVYTDWIVQ